jgi:hypothetical protein
LVIVDHLPLLSLHLSLPLLDLNLTLHPVSSLAARGRRHLQWSPETISDEHDRMPLQDLLLASFGRGGVSRETAAAPFPVARARVLPYLRREGDDGSPPSIPF